MSAITSRKCGIRDVNALSRPAFVELLGGIFEHSPWIAETAAGRRPFASVEDLHAAVTDLVVAAGREKQLALINAHPDLAGRLARQGLLTAESAREQEAAGLARSDRATLEKIGTLNSEYRARFGFPFIICARLNNVETIRSAMEARVKNSPEKEAETALGEIFQIARLRLADIVED